MIFTGLGTIVASLTLIAAAGRIGLAIYIMTSIPSAEEAAFWSARYLGSPTALGSLDASFTVLAFALALGILTEISRTLRRNL